MSRNLFRLVQAACLLGILSTPVAGQKPGQSGSAPGQAAQNSQSGGPSGSQGLQGISYSPADWPYLILPDVKGVAPTWKEGRTVVCYRVAKANSSTQPFILQPVASNEIESSAFYRPCGDEGSGETDHEGQSQCKKKAAQVSHHWSPCSVLNDRKDPLLMNQILVVAVDISDLGDMGVNVDQLKLLNINVTNQQGAALNPSPIRPSFPATNAGGGGGGQAGSVGSARDTSGKGNWWVYVGTQPPGGGYPRHWRENQDYKKGDVVTDSSGLRFFMANRDFRSGHRPLDPLPNQPRVERTLDGEVIWQEMNDPGPNPRLFSWSEQTDYKRGDIVCKRDPNSAPEPEREKLVRLLPGPNIVTHQLPMSDFFDPSPGLLDDTTAPEEKMKPVRCEELRKKITEKGASLHFYWAIKGGKSGSVPADPLSIVLIPRAIYLEWPYQLSADVIPTFNVNLVYSPPVPGAPWQGNTFYPAGSVVTSSTNKGHYYTALTGGFSTSEPKEPGFPVDLPPTFNDGTLVWIDSGTSTPNVPATPGTGSAQSSGGGQGGGQGTGGSASGKAQLWFENTHYVLGDVIFNPDNGHYYTVEGSTGGFSGPMPSSPAAPPDPFPPTPSQTTPLVDGQVQWSKAKTSAANDWKPKTPYSIGDKMLASNGLSYVMIGSTATSGLSGGANTFPIPPTPNVQQRDGDIYWLYSSQVTAAQDWQVNHPYSLGNAVLDGNNNVYVMVGTAKGISGSTDPIVQNSSGQPVTVPDGDLLWEDIGTSTPIPAPNPWIASHNYNMGDTVLGTNGHYYRVIRFLAGTSGVEKPSFPILQSSTVIEPEKTIPDPGPAGLMWVDLGVVRPPGLKAGEPLRWQPETFYVPDSVIFAPGVGNGRYYRALNGGQSGDTSPFLNLAPSLPITWLDSGTTTPASVASGQPTDQNVSLINLTLPQTHSLSYFNISAGVVVDIARPPVFGFVQASNPSIKLPTGYIPGPVPTTTPTNQLAIEPKTGCTVSTTPVANMTPTSYYAFYCPTRVKTGPYPVDPVLALTLYFPPVDAETPLRFKWRYLKRDLIPGISFGMSLSNPTTNFYAGGSNELLVRNVQLFYGVAFHNIATGLAPGPSQPVWGGVGTAPTVSTVSGFQRGFFIGGTFNLSGFIQSLFGGGGGKG